MLEILLSEPVHLVPQVVPGVHHLVAERVLEVLAVADLVCADEDAVLRAEAAGLPVDLAVLGEAGRAAPADDVGGVEPAVERGHLVPHENHRGRVAEGPVPVLVAALAVGRLVGAVPRLPVVELAFGRDRARQDLEVVDPPGRLGVEACPLRVVFDDLGQG